MEFFVPFYNHLIERIRFRNIILALIQRFKHRTEWFTRKEIYDKYVEGGQKEKILNNYLQLYLYDQGIDFPLSSPESPSREVDIVARPELPDAPIIEIKIFDPARGYNISYLSHGFKQNVQYTKDYNKPIGCLVIFNSSNSNLIFESEQNSEFKSVNYDSKTIYIIIIDINPSRDPASKRKEPSDILKEDELTK